MPNARSQGKTITNINVVPERSRPNHPQFQTQMRNQSKPSLFGAAYSYSAYKRSTLQVKLDQNFHMRESPSSSAPRDSLVFLEIQKMK